MAVLNLDFSAASDDLVDEGEHLVTIEKVEAKPSNSGGSPNLSWTCTVIDGPHKNRKLFMTTGTSEKALWKLKETLQALGVYEEGMAIVTDDGSNLIIQPRLSGLSAVAKVTHREWEGRKRAGIESLRSMNGASPNGGQQFR